MIKPLDPYFAISYESLEKIAKKSAEEQATCVSTERLKSLWTAYMNKRNHGDLERAFILLKCFRSVFEGLMESKKFNLHCEYKYFEKIYHNSQVCLRNLSTSLREIFYGNLFECAKKKIDTIQSAQLKEVILSSNTRCLLLVDVRSNDLFLSGHIKYSQMTNIPQNDILNDSTIAFVSKLVKADQSLRNCISRIRLIVYITDTAYSSMSYKTAFCINKLKILLEEEILRDSNMRENSVVIKHAVLFEGFPHWATLYSSLCKFRPKEIDLQTDSKFDDIYSRHINNQDDYSLNSNELDLLLFGNAIKDVPSPLNSISNIPFVQKTFESSNQIASNSFESILFGDSSIDQNFQTTNSNNTPMSSTVKLLLEEPSQQNFVDSMQKIKNRDNPIKFFSPTFRSSAEDLNNQTASIKFGTISENNSDFQSPSSSTSTSVSSEFIGRNNREFPEKSSSSFVGVQTLKFPNQKSNASEFLSNIPDKKKVDFDHHRLIQPQNIEQNVQSRESFNTLLLQPQVIANLEKFPPMNTKVPFTKSNSQPEQLVPPPPPPPRNTYRGLSNMGNTCYINSVLQSLASVKFIVDLCKNYLNKHVTNNNHIMWEFCSIIIRLNIPDIQQKGSLLPTSFVGKLETLSRSLILGVEQDAQEFLILLLDVLHLHLIQMDQSSNLNNLRNNDDDNRKISIRSKEDVFREGHRFWQNYRLKNRSEIFTSFYGMLQYCITCSRCGNISVSHEIFSCLHLSFPSNDQFDNIKPHLNIVSAINLMLHPEEIGIDQGWKCEECKHVSSATKRTFLWKLPPVLVLHFQRFAVTMSDARKINDTVSIAQSLELTDCYSMFSSKSKSYTNSNHHPSGSVPKSYSLISSVHHIGVTLTAGHYTATCFRKLPTGLMNQNIITKQESSDLWFRFNDEIVDEVAGPPTSSDDVYMLFYVCNSL